MFCISCKKETTNRAYCSNACQHEVQKEKRRLDFLEGKLVGKHICFKTGSWQRQLLIEIFGYRCNHCGCVDWNGKPLTLEVNHKDGIATNNNIVNLEFVCPNCHSQTPTFRALNKKSTRAHRKRGIGIAGNT